MTSVPPIGKKLWLEAAAVFCAHLILLQPLLGRVIILVYQSRDLDRARMIAEGAVFLFGPEMSGGSHLPGPLYYWLLAIPAALGYGWQGAVQLMFVFSALTAALLWVFVRRLFGPLFALLTVVNFSFSPFFQRTLQDFLNSSFLPLFAIGAIAGLLLLLCDLTERRRAVAVATGMAFGLGLQFHFSIALFALSALFLHCFAPALGLRRFSARELVASIAVVALILAPYTLFVVAAKFGVQLGQAPLGFTDGATQAPGFVLDRMINQVRTGSFKPWHSVAVLFTPRSALVPLSLCLAVLAVTRISPQLPPMRLGRVWKVLMLMALITSVPAMLMTKGEIRTRYAICFASVTLLFWPAIAASVAHWFIPKERAVVALVTAALAWAGGTAKLSTSHLGAEDFTTMAEEIHKRTGWGYSEARGRLYFLNIREQHSIKHYFPPPSPVRSDAPDGFLVGIGQVPLPDKVKWAAELAEGTIATGLHSGAIALGDPIFVAGKLTLLPYQVKDKQNFPAHFHNQGLEYHPGPKTGIAQSEVTGKSGVAAVFHSCAQQSDDCRWSIRASSKDLTDPTSPVAIAVEGLPLSLSTRWIAPDLTQMLVHPYIEFKCGGEWRRTQIAARLGGNLRDPLTEGRIAINAPFYRTVVPDCRQRIESVRIGFKNSVVARGFMQVRTGPRAQEFDLAVENKKR